MCTPALREVKRLNPRCRVTFYTRYRQLVDGLSFLDEVKEYPARPASAIEMWYEHLLPPGRHIARIMGESVGVVVREIRPSCMIKEDMLARAQEKLQSLPRPHIAVNRDAGPWTPNKAWPAEYWDSLVESLAQWATVVEIGVGKLCHVPQGNYFSLLGRTSLEELVAAIAAVDLLVSPISGPVHIAAAAGVRSVVIYGGYEHPVCSKYPGNINLYSATSCSPCWLRAPCPHDRVCLRLITPELVEKAIRIGLGQTHRESGSPRARAPFFVSK
jgi:hypothetical protein